MLKNALRAVMTCIDSELHTSLYKTLVDFRDASYRSRFLNAIRRAIGKAKIGLKYTLGINDEIPIKLHLGCGSKHLDGYINIDWRKTSATDLVCDISRLPYPNNVAEQIEIYHVIERVPRHDLPNAFERWYAFLIPGGKLIIECPDFNEIVKHYLVGDERQLAGIFGLQRFEGDYHLFGYNSERLSNLLKDAGFTNVEAKPPRDYHAIEWPCLRFECTKTDDMGRLPSNPLGGSNLQFTGERVVEGITPWRIWLDHVARYNFAAKHVMNKVVLDIACGTGFGSRILLEKGARNVIGMDISEEAIEFANNVYGREKLEFILGDITATNFWANAFDTIVCFETIEHIKDRAKALAELRRILKPEGLLLISSPNRIVTSPRNSIEDQPLNPFHDVEYTTKEFASAVGEYFHVVGVYGQRGILRVFFIPTIQRLLKRFYPMLFNARVGKPGVEAKRATREYRYLLLVCTNSKK